MWVFFAANRFEFPVWLSARSKRTPQFDLTIPRADFQAGLRVHSWPVEYPAILQCKPREVIWAHDGVPLEFAFGERPAKVGACLSHGKQTISATDQQDRLFPRALLA